MLVVVAVPFLADFVGDKLPAPRRPLHAGGMVVHPIAGAILFDAHAGAHSSWVVAAILGGGTAALLHGARAIARPAVAGVADGGAPVAETVDVAAAEAHSAGTPQIATGDRPVPGLGGLTMSLLEDAAAALLVIVAFSLPAIAGVLVILLVAGAVTAARHVRRLEPPPRAAR